MCDLKGSCTDSEPGTNKGNLGGTENVGWELGQCMPNISCRVNYFIKEK